MYTPSAPLTPHNLIEFTLLLNKPHKKVIWVGVKSMYENHGVSIYKDPI